MLDPLSIAGLTIAIFDQLLKLGERTCQLIADAKTFDDVSRLPRPSMSLHVSQKLALFVLIRYLGAQLPTHNVY